MNYETKTNSELVNETKLLKASLEEAERKISKYKHDKHDKRLQKLTELCITLSGEPLDIFKRVAVMIAELLDIPIVCLSEIQGDELYFLSIYNKGEILTNAGHCPIGVTPCSAVRDSKQMRIYQNVIEKFPNVPLLRKHNAFTYCGFPSIDSEGNVISITFLLDDKQHEFSDEEKNLLLIFSQRIGTEMERKKHIAKCKKAESERDRFFNNSIDMLCIAGLDGRFKQLNPAWTTTLGWRLDELLSRPWLSFIHPDDQQLTTEAGEQLQNGKSVVEFENRYQCKDGTYRWISWNSFPILEEKQIFAVARDITERKHTEERLKGSLERSRVWLDNSPVCTKVVDLDFNLKYMSAAGIKALKIDDVTTLYGKPYPFDFFPESTKRGMVKNLRKVKETGETITGEAPVCDIEGNELWFQATFVPVRGDNDIIDFIIVVSVDINERKKMEQALIQSEKLKSIGTITAGISHEFNNILMIISGNIQLLSETYKDQGPLIDVLRTISKAVSDGTEISNNMLKFTKTEQDTTKFISSDIRDLITQSVEFTMPRWKNMAQVKGLNYLIDTENMKKIPHIMCNPRELREVFINMINNALDAMPGGGSITFCTWNTDEAVFVSIADTGDGMTEDIIKNIFDPFFSTKTPRGTGLGMSIAYGIVARYRGKIDIKSELGRGSMFTLQFPSTIDSVSSIVAHKPEQETKGKGLSVLVVDDEEEICNILDRFLSKCGNKVKVVNNGADAIALINSEHFDLVLCDIAMPDVFGYDVIRAFNWLEKRPKIGIITGCGEKLRPVDEEGIKVDFILKKPFKLSELSKYLNDAF